MASKKVKDFFTVIKDEEHWESFINEDNKKLSIVDAYMSFTGPTEMMFPTWKAIINVTEEWENRMEFLLLDHDKVPVKIPGKSGFVASPKPRFFLIIQGELKDEVVGMDIPDMQEKIARHIPML
mmetsp:Transcript_1662/g.1771  ORF Transcript_1662/g.1771 Transcript_1662/m.1771 type:complete len:124 (+) Transcript_1662:57-428(+)